MSNFKTKICTKAVSIPLAGLLVLTSAVHGYPDIRNNVSETALAPASQTNIINKLSDAIERGRQNKEFPLVDPQKIQRTVETVLELPEILSRVYGMQFALDPRLANIDFSTGGWEQRVFPIRITLPDGKKLILKNLQSAESEKNAEEVRYIVSFQNAMKREGFPVAGIVKTVRETGTALDYVFIRDGYYWLLEEYREGEFKPEYMTDTGKVMQLVTAAARIQNKITPAMLEGKKYPRFPGLYAYVKYLDDQVRERDARKLLGDRQGLYDEYKHLLSHHIEQISRREKTFHGEEVPVHSDLDTNVLYDPSGKMSALFDFGSAHQDQRYCEFRNTIVEPLLMQTEEQRNYLLLFLKAYQYELSPDRKMSRDEIRYVVQVALPAYFLGRLLYYAIMNRNNVMSADKARRWLESFACYSGQTDTDGKVDALVDEVLDARTPAQMLALINANQLVGEARVCADGKKLFEAGKLLRRAQELMQEEYPARQDVLKSITDYADKIRKEIIVNSMGVAYRKAFEEFTGRSVSRMSAREIDELLIPFQAIFMRDQNLRHYTQISRDGYFNVSYVLDLFLDANYDSKGIQAAIMDKYGVIVGGDALILLRDDNGDLYLFQMDAMGHGMSAARIIEAVVPFVYKEWEERRAVFMNEEMFARLDEWVSRYCDMKGLHASFVTMNALHISAADGKTEYYSLGADPALLVSGDGKTERIMSDGGIIGVAWGPPVYQKVESFVRRGDRLILFSDGVTEARIAGRELYGAEKFKELLNKYIAEAYTLPAGRAAESVLRKIKKETTLTGKQEATLKQYLINLYAARLASDSDIADIVQANPVISSQQFNQLTLDDIRNNAKIDEELRLWKLYVDKRLDAFLDSYKGTRKQLYASIITDYALFHNIDKLRTSAYAGNSLHLCALINKNIDLPKDDLIALIKKNHAAFTDKPVSHAEIAGDDLTLVSILYTKQAAAGTASASVQQAGKLTLTGKGASAEPEVRGTAHEALFREVLRPGAEGSARIRDILNDAGSLEVIFFAGKKLSYIKNGVLYINERFFSEDAGMRRCEELLRKRDAGGLTADETKELRLMHEALLPLVFLITVQGEILSQRTRDYTPIIARAVDVFARLTRKKDQDRIIKVLKNYRKDDPLAEGFFNLFTGIRAVGAGASVRKEQERLALFLAHQERIEVLFDAVAGSASAPPWDDIARLVAGLDGAAVVDLGLEREAQRCLNAILDLLADEKKQGTVEEKERVGRAIADKMNDMGNRQEVRRKEQEHGIAVLLKMHEMAPGESSVLRGALPELLRGEIMVEDLKFVKEGQDGCVVKKGKKEYGKIPSLKDMRVFMKGTVERVVLDIKEGKPVILMFNLRNQKLSVAQYVRGGKFVLVSPRYMKFPRTGTPVTMEDMVRLSVKVEGDA